MFKTIWNLIKKLIGVRAHCHVEVDVKTGAGDIEILDAKVETKEKPKD